MVWSPRAQKEFDEYLTWLAERGPQIAERSGEEIVAWVERLAIHPQIGHPVQGWAGFLKHSLPARSKFVIYEFTDDAVQIAAFRDSRQDNSNLRIVPAK